jgi:hypothetical protein
MAAVIFQCNIHPFEATALFPEHVKLALKPAGDFLIG